MVPYKKIDLIVETFSQLPDKKLMVVGEGPDFKKIQGKAGKNIVFLKGLPRQEVKDLLARAKAFVFAAEEDFGIATVEAQSSGTPVIAYGRGGSLETVQGIFADECAQQADFTDRTGIFFPRQDVPSLKKAMECFETHQDRILPAACRRHAERFSIARFQREFKEFVEDAWNAFQESPRAQVNPGDGVGPPL